MIKQKIQPKESKNVVNLFHKTITPSNQEWNIIRQLQHEGKLPSFLREVFIYTIPRQYERGVYEMEHFQVLEVELTKAPMFLAFWPRYTEKILHYTCYNPREGRLHVLLRAGFSSESLEKSLEREPVFTLPAYT
ncbi:MAG TPA: hypothetical protein VMT01_02695 [Candidatus Acidoferrum sp.]|nr:hypothetical protein [Candidatus Acidoferrum sp.]